MAVRIEKLKQLLLESGESDSLEFKKSTSLLSKAFETVCAFLNGNGGLLLIGINDSGKIIGQGVTDSTKREIAREVSKIEPSTQINIEYITVGEGKKVIQITVAKSQFIPHTYDGRPYQRIESSTQKMSQHLYEQLIIARGQLNHDWESQLSNKYSINDLDENTIYETISDGVNHRRVPAVALKESIPEILSRFRLINNDTPTNAALILFAKDNLQLPQCQMKMARFQGVTKLGDFIDNQAVTGNAFKLLVEADAFLMKHLPISSSFKGSQLKRIDTPALPHLAVREALVNAFCHREYANAQTDFSIAIYDDRVEIWNGGLLPPGLTIEALKQPHQSILRNKLISNVFYLRNYIERWGTGTNKMVEICKESKIPEPDFEEMTGGILVTFWLKAQKTDGITSDENDFHMPLSERQKHILSILSQSGPMGASDIHQNLKDPPSLRMIQKDLKSLKERDFIMSTGQAQRTVWVLKDE